MFVRNYSVFVVSHILKRVYSGVQLTEKLCDNRNWLTLSRQAVECHLLSVAKYISCPFGYETVSLPLYKVADKPFHIQGDDITLHIHLLYHLLYHSLTFLIIHLYIVYSIGSIQYNMNVYCFAVPIKEMNYVSRGDGWKSS